MKQSIIRIRVDKEDKKGFENFCNQIGMNVSTVINLFIKNVLREQKLPFEIKTMSYEDYVYEKLKEVEDHMERGEEKFYTIEEVFEELKYQLIKIRNIVYKAPPIKGVLF